MKASSPTNPHPVTTLESVVTGYIPFCPGVLPLQDSSNVVRRQKKDLWHCPDCQYQAEDFFHGVLFPRKLPVGPSRSAQQFSKSITHRITDHLYRYRVPQFIAQMHHLLAPQWDNLKIMLPSQWVKRIRDHVEKDGHVCAERRPEGNNKRDCGVACLLVRRYTGKDFDFSSSCNYSAQRRWNRCRDISICKFLQILDTFLSDYQYISAFWQ